MDSHPRYQNTSSLALDPLWKLIKIAFLMYSSKSVDLNLLPKPL